MNNCERLKKEIMNSVTLKELIYVFDSDRMIYIERNMDGNISGLNFWQGDSEIIDPKVDKSLYELFLVVISMPRLINNIKSDAALLEIIDEVCWLYHKLKTNQKIRLLDIK